MWTESQAPLQDVLSAIVTILGDFLSTFDDGLVDVHVTKDGLSGAMVEINSKTDFFARNGKFKALFRRVADALTTFKPVV